MKEVFLFFGDGRLGNQMFQIAFLSHIQDKYGWSVVAFNMGEAKRTFEVKDKRVRLLRSDRVSRKLGRGVQKVLRFLASHGVIGRLTAIRIPVLGESAEDGTYSFKAGLFSNICFGEFGFFQTEEYIRNVELPFAFSKDLTALAKKSFAVYSAKFPGKNLYFVHVRLGDYADYKIFGRNSILPTKYYCDGIDKIKNQDSNAHFLVFSDSLDKARALFINEMNLTIVDDGGSAGFDLCLMSMCCGGVLSASSFSWWAGVIASRSSSYRVGTIIAPNYWLGHESREWYPRSVEAQSFVYLNV